MLLSTVIFIFLCYLSTTLCSVPHIHHSTWSSLLFHGWYLTNSSFTVLQTSKIQRIPEALKENPYIFSPTSFWYAYQPHFFSWAIVSVACLMKTINSFFQLQIQRYIRISSQWVFKPQQSPSSRNSYTCECPHPFLRITAPDFMLLRTKVTTLK